MKVKQIDNVYVVRLEIGDEIFESLTTLSKQENIKAATVQGLGAVDKIDIGYYSTDDNIYHTTEYNKQMEIISLNGNISVKNGEPYLHLHGAFSDEKYSMIAGHLNKAFISITAEIFVTVLGGEIIRGVNKQTGLNVFDI